MKNLLTALTIVFTLASAQAGPAIPVELKEAARKAVNTNPEVQARWHAFLQADAERDSVAAARKPQIDFTAGVGRENSNTPSTGNNTYNIGSASIALNQVLYDGGFTGNEIKRASHAKLVRYYELVDAAENTVFEVTKAYADVLRYRKLVEMSKDNFIVHHQISEQINARVKAGVGRRVDAEQAAGRLALAESNMLTELANLHDVSARYLRLVGEAPPKKLGDLPTAMNFSTMPSSITAVLARAYLNNPALNAAVENIDAQRTLIGSANSENHPHINFRLRSGYDRNTGGIGGDYYNTSAQVILTYNLYRGGRDRAKEQMAINGVYQAEDVKEKVCRDTRQTVMIAYHDIGKISEQLKYLDQHRLAIEKSREAYRQQFDIGQRTLLDLLDTQNEFYEADRAYTKARYDLTIAEVRTMAGLGDLTSAIGTGRADMPTPADAGQTRTRDLTGVCTVPSDFETTIDKAQLLANAAPIAKPVVVAPIVVPAPVVPTPAIVVVPAKVSFSADALFDFGKSNLKPQGETKLAEFARNVKAAHQDRDPLIAIGYTDSIGTDAYNNKLSLARANSVKAFLVANGLDSALIRTEGRGKSNPVADNKTAEGRSKNRRVEIEMIAAK